MRRRPVRPSRALRPVCRANEPPAADPDDAAAPARPLPRGASRRGRGAEFRDGIRVENLEIGEDGVSAVVGGSSVRSTFLVGADGANGVVARASGLGDGIVRGVALEGNMPWAAFDSGPYSETAWVELGVVPGGYGWVFPKGDHANLGVGGWLEEGPRLRAHLDRLARVHGLDPAALTEVRGHRLPMRRLGAKAARGRVLLVGDAAGLVDPLSGDGIYEAFVSARLAADAIHADASASYEAALSAALDRYAAASWKAKRVADRYPRACVWALRAPGVFGCSRWAPARRPRASERGSATRTAAA